MGLNWLGQRANPGDQSPFKILLGISIFAVALSALNLSLYSRSVSSGPNNGTRIKVSPNPAMEAINRTFRIVLSMFSIYVIMKTRRHIRERSGIPWTRWQWFEDCLISTYCGCCTVMQMASHTAEYEVYAAQCCSETGLTVHAPQQLHFGGAQIV